MSKNIIFEMSQSESLIMNFLWKEGGAKSFVEIMTFLNEKEGKEWKKQTVNTFIKRLSDKGLIMADETGKNRVYHASVTIAEFEKGKTKKFLNDFYGGSVYSFLSALTGGKGVDKKFADDLRILVEKEFTEDKEN